MCPLGSFAVAIAVQVSTMILTLVAGQNLGRNLAACRAFGGLLVICRFIWVWVKKLVPKWNPVKWKNCPKPA